jgi:hypothetical protein
VGVPLLGVERVDHLYAFPTTPSSARFCVATPQHRVALHLDSPLAIGAWIGDGAAYSTSRIDGVAVFDDLLSATRIASLAAHTATPQTVGPGTLPDDTPDILARASSEYTADGRLAVATVNGAGLVGQAHAVDPRGTMGLTARADDTDPRTRSSRR